MALSTYREVLAQPKAPSIFFLGFLARFPFSATGLVLTLHAVLTLGETYFMAGLIVTSATLGAAISSPWRGRMLDERGIARTLIPPIIVNLVFWMSAPFMAFWVLLPAVFVAGLFSIPVFSIVRTSLSVIIPARLRKSAFALDSVFTEFVFMTGPAVATVFAFSIGTKETMMIVGASIVVAGIGLILVDPPLTSDKLVLPTKLPGPLEAAEEGMMRGPAQAADRLAFENTQTGQIPIITDPDGESHEDAAVLDEARSLARRQLLSLGGLAILVATAIGNVILVATDLGIVAVLEDLGQAHLVGLVVSVWCAGSAVGGLTYGAMKHDISPLWVLFILAVLTFPIALAASLPAILVLIFIAGLGVAPILASTGEAVARKVPEIARGEAMGWHGSAMTIGAAAGGPVIGVIIDAGGPAWGFITAGAIGVLVAGGGLAATKIHRARVRAQAAADFGIYPHAA